MNIILSLKVRLDIFPPLRENLARLARSVRVTPQTTVGNGYASFPIKQNEAALAMEDPGARSLAAINDHSEPARHQLGHTRQKKALQPSGLPMQVSRLNTKEKGTCPASGLSSFP